MPSADLLLCFRRKKKKERKKRGKEKRTVCPEQNSASSIGKIPVLWAPHPHLLMWSKFFLWRHLIKKPWLIYMDTFDLNYTPNHTKLGASVNAKCLFPATGRIGPALDGTCSSDEKYFRCNILLRPTFPLIIHNELNQYLYLDNYFRLWKKKCHFTFKRKGRKKEGWTTA